MKRLIVLLLILAMSSLFISNVFAATCPQFGYCNIIHSECLSGQCVAYCRSKTGFSGNISKGWATYWPINYNKPIVGGVVVLNLSTYGHVAYIESVNENEKKFTVSQFNAGSKMICPECGVTNEYGGPPINHPPTSATYSFNDKRILGYWKSGQTTPSPPPSPNATNINDIKQAYRDILGREADSGGLNGYYNSGLSINSIRQSLLNSNECRQGKGGECAKRYGSGSSQPSPTPQPIHLSEGNLIRLKGQTQVFVISGGKKCHIPDPETFNARGFKWDQIKEVDQNTFNSVPTGNTLASVKQSVAQTPSQSQPDVNRINDIKQAYRDVLGREADTGGLTGYYNGGQSIGAIRQSLLNSSECHQGKGGECARRYASANPQPSSSPQPTRLSEGTLCRLKGQNQVYVISGGKKCYIPDPETFNARGFNWNQIKEIDQATYNSVPTGPALASVKTTVAQPSASTPSPQPQQIDYSRLNAIKQVYRDVLGREADSGGLTGYYNGGQSIGAIRQSLLNSNECRQGKGGECASLYAASKSQPTSSPQPNRPGEGSLIRLQGKQEVYVISGGRKCYIPDPETLFSRWRADQIKDIDQNTFNSIPTGNPLASVKKTQQSQTTTTSPQTIRVNPQIGISTKSSGFGDSNASGKQGDAFYTHGKGFSPNSSISFHVKKPDGSEFPPSDYRTNGSGEFSNTYNSHCGSLVGTYHIWVVDKATGKGSNTVTEKMAKSSKCK